MKMLSRIAAIAALFAPAATAASPAQAQSEPRHYDCSKPGNADKAVCKAAATAAANQAPASGSAESAKPRHYDCTKAGNADKQACKAAAAAANSAPPPVIAGASHAAATAGSHENDDPTGAIAQCKDGKYSHAAHREGACADHGGVAKWLRN